MEDSQSAKSGSRRLKWLSRIGLVLAVLIACGGVAVWIYLPRPDETIRIACEVEGQTRMVTVDCFYPGSKERLTEPLPGVVILHGVEGAEKYELQHFYNARRVAQAGYAVYFVHYFDTSSYETISVHGPDGRIDTTEVDRCIACDHARWIETVAQTVKALSQRTEVDGKRIGLLGYSLGCFVSLSAAERAGEQGVKIAAVVGNWGAMFRDAKFQSDYPPVCLLHGEQDGIVSCQYARDTAEYLRNHNVKCELTTYPGQGHILTGEAAADSARKTLAFFAERLQSKTTR